MFNRTAAVEIVRTTKLTPSTADQTTYATRGLRIMFSSKRGDGKGEAKVVIYNLSEASREEFAKRPCHVRVFAGYQDTGESLVISGDVRFAESKRDGGDWATTLELGEAERALLSGRFTRSYDAGVRKSQVLKDLCAAAGLANPSLPADERLLTGLSVTGKISDGLDKLLGRGTWVAQNGALQLSSKNLPTAILLSEATGLIGIPERVYTEDKSRATGATLVSTLAPDIVVGSIVKVSSKTVTGTFKVVTVEHDADTHGANWQTKLTVKIL